MFPRIITYTQVSIFMLLLGERQASMARSYSCLKQIQTSSNINISSDSNVPGTWQTVLGNMKIVLERLGEDEESEDIINWEAMISLKTVRCKLLTDDLSAQPTDDLSSYATDDLSAQPTDDLSSYATDDFSSYVTDDLSSQATDDLSSQETKDMSIQPGAIILDSGSIYLVPSMTGNETTDEGDETDKEVIDIIEVEEEIFQDIETEEDTKELTIEESDTKEDAEERELDETLRQPVAMGYVTYPGVGTFKLHAESRHWNRASEVCQSEQAHLVVVDTQDKVDALLDLFSSQPHIPSRAILRNQVYVGITDQFLEGEFYTVFGELFQPWDQSIWAPGEPDEQSPGEDCVTFHESGKIRDVPCFYSLPFVCQLDLWSVTDGENF